MASARFDWPLPTWPPEQLRRWMEADWPGNVRDLRNFADRLVLGIGEDANEASTIDEIVASANAASLSARVNAFERQLIEEALRQNQASFPRRRRRCTCRRRRCTTSCVNTGSNPSGNSVYSARLASRSLRGSLPWIFHHLGLLDGTLRAASQADDRECLLMAGSVSTPERQEADINRQRCQRRSKSEPPCRPNIEPGVEADFEIVGCG